MSLVNMELSIPTLMIFKGGQKVDTVVGAVPKTLFQVLYRYKIS